MAAKRLVVGVSGASGVQLAVHLLEVLRTTPGWESHLVVSGGALRTLELESDFTFDDLATRADVVHHLRDIGASIASGSFETAGMVVIPCSMKTMAGIACGYSDNLLLRAADVTLKERRKLVLVARETPLSLIHLRNMTVLAEMGAVILPPMLTFYTRPRTIGDMTHHLVCKVLGEFGIAVPGYRRWNGELALADAPPLEIGDPVAHHASGASSEPSGESHGD